MICKECGLGYPSRDRDDGNCTKCCIKLNNIVEGRLHLEGFEIESDGTYIHIKRGDVHVQVKFDDDGVAVDMYGKSDDGGVAACWAEYSDFD